MNLYVYADESGVFDAKHYPIFVYAGVVFLGDDEKDKWTRLYKRAENTIRDITHIKGEIKASNISNSNKVKLYRSLNGTLKFAVVISSRKLNQKIFENKKHKQRYLDYAFKIVLKHLFKALIQNGFINPNDIDHIYVNPDEHSTATDGRYELQESLYNEFKNGTFNMNYNTYFEPIFPNMRGSIYVKFCDSSSNILVRAADIIANHIYYLANIGQGLIESQHNLFTIYLPASY